MTTALRQPDGSWRHTHVCCECRRDRECSDFFDEKKGQCPTILEHGFWTCPDCKEKCLHVPCDRCFYGRDPLEPRVPSWGWKPGMVMSDGARDWFREARRREENGTLGPGPRLGPLPGPVPEPIYVPCSLCGGTGYNPLTVARVRASIQRGEVTSSNVVLWLCDLVESRRSDTKEKSP